MNKTADAAEIKKPSAVYSVVKRCLDLLFALLMLLFAAIPMLVIILAIRLDTGEKALFRQKRVGRNGALFDCFKFRTMKKDAPSSMSKKTLENADGYITRTGSFLRKTSLDELPQLFNIIKGEMSFIGPRPLIPEEVSVHRMREACGVYQLRPGISGYAQINGRDMISDEKKAALDRYYLEHFSLTTDMKIVLGTVFNVLKEKDIHQGAIDKDE